MMNKKSNQNHLDYWSERSDEIFRYLDRKDIDFFAELNKVYQEQANEMQKAFYDFVSKYSESGAISYQEALQRLKGTDLSDYRENARKYREQAEKDPELLKRLNEQYTTARATRLESLQLDMLFRAGVARGLIADKFESYLQKMALMGYKKAMSGRTGTINEPALKELVKTPFNGYNYSQQLWGNTDNLVKDLKKILKAGFVRGDHPRTMARDLAQKYKVANSRAETLIRTDGTMIVNRSAVQRYKDAGLKYYRILVHLDNRTTEICKRIHAEDKRYLIDEMQAGVNAPPFHFNCRSGVIPDEEELNEGYNEEQEQKASNFEEDKVFVADKPSEIDDFFKEQKSYQKWYNELTDDERSAIYSYTTENYHNFNNIKRYGLDEALKIREKFWFENDGSAEDLPFALDIVKDTKSNIPILEKAISKFAPEKSFKAYRGSGSISALGEDLGYMDLEVGQTVRLDKTFTSFSLDRNYAKEFAFDGDGANVLFEVTVKKGQKTGAYIAELADFSPEKEYLMKPNLRYNVISKTESKDGLLVYGLEVLENGS
jgi:SPP1 gp7 family putative phage head morphogenesis protein|nr:minor capsid protein [uncultured Streptococcus sp.]